VDRGNAIAFTKLTSIGEHMTAAYLDLLARKANDPLEKEYFWIGRSLNHRESRGVEDNQVAALR
jgi:hypothetical protein